MTGRPCSFESAGLKLAGMLYEPPGEPSPRGRAGIVLCQGYTGTKEMFLPLLAAAFAEAGAAALIFDYRGYGESEGERGRLFPEEELEDIRAALEFVASEPGVDVGRLGLFGTSFGGGLAVAAAAADQRVRCVVASLSVANGRRWLRSLRRLWEWQQLLDEIEADRRSRAAGAPSRKVPAFELAPPDPTIRALMEEAATGGMFAGADVAITLESAEAIMTFAPEEVVGRLSPRPVLFLHGDRDTLVSLEESESLYARAGEPKRLHVVRGAGHIDFYLGDALEEVKREAVGWFRRYLIEPRVLPGTAGAGPDRQAAAARRNQGA